MGYSSAEENIFSWCYVGDRFGPGATSAPEASFPIQDVLENYIYYFQSVHESIEPTHDVFSFYVSDGSSRSEIHSINITIEVRILAIGDEAFSLTLAHSEKSCP